MNASNGEATRTIPFLRTSVKFLVHNFVFRGTCESFPGLRVILDYYVRLQRIDRLPLTDSPTRVEVYVFTIDRVHDLDLDLDLDLRSFPSRCWSIGCASDFVLGCGSDAWTESGALCWCSCTSKSCPSEDSSLVPSEGCPLCDSWTNTCISRVRLFRRQPMSEMISSCIFSGSSFSSFSPSLVCVFFWRDVAFAMLPGCASAFFVSYSFPRGSRCALGTASPGPCSGCNNRDPSSGYRSPNHVSRRRISTSISVLRITE